MNTAIAPATAAKPVTKKKKQNRSRFYRISAWLHLWLGLVTGLIMMVVCLTGCIWIFNDEITALLNPEIRIARQDKAVLTPSQLEAIAVSKFPGQKIASAQYQQGRAVLVNMGESRKPSAQLRIHPYTGEVISAKKLKKDETDFFRSVLNGHRWLWLPPKVGRPIINYSTLIFVFILITGIVMWWPKKWNKSTRKQSFTIKWKGTAKRVNYDLHNVLGFYSLLLLAAISMTGIVYGIEWWSKGLYWVTSGGTPMAEGRPPKSDSTQLGSRFASPAQAMDGAWNIVVARHPESKGFYYAYADTAKPSSNIAIYTYPSVGRYFDRTIDLFDQHTLEPLKGNKIFDGAYADASGADKLRRMNYDIHVGSIWGLPGRVLAFLVSLIGASLPVTGFIVWWGRKRKEWKKARKKERTALAKGAAKRQVKPVPVEAVS